MAVERLARQGRLDLQSTVVTQEEEEEEEGGVEPEEGEEEENIEHDEEPSAAAAAGLENNSNCGDREKSSQQVVDNFDKNPTSETSSNDVMDQENFEAKDMATDRRGDCDNLEEVEQIEETFSTADIEDMRDNLVSASQDAQQLLSDLNTRWS